MRNCNVSLGSRGGGRRGPQWRGVGLAEGPSVGRGLGADTLEARDYSDHNRLVFDASNFEPRKPAATSPSPS